MDDFNVSSLHESKNEWGSRLLTILTPLVVEGLKSIFEEAVLLCKSNNEMDKYLMTFQNFISRIPKWNANIIETEKNRIIERSGCGYLEDLVTCVHIIQLKLLTAIRVGQKQKKIDITIPKLDDFVHKIYINVARKIYKTVYLFERNIPPLQTQKNQRELEIIIQECILNTVRESIPVETILRAYMDETVEEYVTEEIKEEVVEIPKEEAKEYAEEKEKEKEKEKPHIISEQPSLESENEKIIETQQQSYIPEIPDFPELPEDTSQQTQVTFSNSDNFEETVRKVAYDSEDDETESENVRLRIQDHVNLDSLDVHNLDPAPMNLTDDLLLDDIEVLA